MGTPIYSEDTAIATAPGVESVVIDATPPPIVDDDTPEPAQLAHAGLPNPAEIDAADIE